MSLQDPHHSKTSVSEVVVVYNIIIETTTTSNPSMKNYKLVTASSLSVWPLAGNIRCTAETLPPVRH
jgi:hypothetical protein